MEAIVKETLKEWLPDSWKKAISDIRDESKIELVLLDLIKQCMPADDFELFSLVTKIHDDLIDEEQKEKEIENYKDTHKLDDDFDFMEEEFPLSRFKIDFNKFQSLVLGYYKWIYEHSMDVDKNMFNPDRDISCHAYIYTITFDIFLRFSVIKLSIIGKHNEKIKEDALSILKREWENISVEDYDKAIDMLKSVKAYDELIEVLTIGVNIKGDHGWKVKRSDKIAALKIAEEATKIDNVTLKGWVDLLKLDYNSGSNPENTHHGILEKLYNEGSGLAALILGDYIFKSVLVSIDWGRLFKKWSERRFETVSEALNKTLYYYKTAAERNCAVGYRNCALIYDVLGDKDKSESFEQEYQKSPYDYKRSAFNLEVGYNKALELEKEHGCRFTKNYWAPAPFSIIALNDQKAKKYLKKEFKGVDLKQLQIS